MNKIIVDSTCDLPEALLRQYDIRVLPLHIILGETEYRDKETIGVEGIYEAMRNGIVPRTSQVSSGDLYDTFQEYCTKGYNFIYIAFSSALSGTYQTSRMILSDFKKKYQNLKMKVLDSRSGSTATGLLALQAAKMVEQGYEYETVLENLNRMIQHIEHLFTITDLKWLVKGGRLDPLHGMIGTLLGVKPILGVKNGSIEVIKKVRGSGHALTYLIDQVAERIREFPEQLIGISHSDNPAGAEALRDAIAERIGAKRFLVNKIGGVLGAHLGIGGLGVFFFNKKFAFYID